MHVIMANRLVDIVSAQAKRYGSREAYRFCWRKDGEWQSTSWNDFGLQVEVAGKALARIGLIEKDTIAICSPNTPQILITEPWWVPQPSFRHTDICQFLAGSI